MIERVISRASVSHYVEVSCRTRRIGGIEVNVVGHARHQEFKAGADCRFSAAAARCKACGHLKNRRAGGKVRSTAGIRAGRRVAVGAHERINHLRVRIHERRVVDPESEIEARGLHNGRGSGIHGIKEAAGSCRRSAIRAAIGQIIADENLSGSGIVNGLGERRSAESDGPAAGGNFRRRGSRKYARKFVKFAAIVADVERVRSIIHENGRCGIVRPATESNRQRARRSAAAITRRRRLRGRSDRRAGCAITCFPFQQDQARGAGAARLREGHLSAIERQNREVEIVPPVL